MYFKNQIIHFISLVIFSITFCLGCSNSNQKSNLNIDNAYIKLPLKGQDLTSGYLNLTNSSKYALILKEIICSDVNSTTFHNSETENNSGLISMKKIESLEVLPGEQVIFSPGRKHLMLIGLSKNLQRGDIINCQIKSNINSLFSVDFEVR